MGETARTLGSLGRSRRKRVYSDRTAVGLVDDRQEDRAIHVLRGSWRGRGFDSPTARRSGQRNLPRCRDSASAAVGEESDTIGDVYEPHLLQEGFIARTARGRVATQRAYAHLNRIRSDAFL